jgi:hypothetical protein
VLKRVTTFNDWLALQVTNGVSTMWCAYIFALIAFVSLKSTLAEHSVNADVQWVAQTFLQLVLLSVIMVGQKVQAQQTISLHDKHDELHDKIDALTDNIQGCSCTQAPDQTAQ